MINVNIALLARRLLPHLAVIDGHLGMEGAGPVSGTPVKHRIALAGRNPLAVDAVCAHLMGFRPQEIGYLVHAARLGLGEIDLAEIEVVGAPLEEAYRRYQPHPGYREQLAWTPVPRPLARLIPGPSTS